MTNDFQKLSVIDNVASKIVYFDITTNEGKLITFALQAEYKGILPFCYEPNSEPNTTWELLLDGQKIGLYHEDLRESLNYEDLLWLFVRACNRAHTGSRYSLNDYLRIYSEYSKSASETWRDLNHNHLIISKLLEQTDFDSYEYFTYFMRKNIHNFNARIKNECE